MINIVVDSFRNFPRVKFQQNKPGEIERTRHVSGELTPAF